MRRTALGLVVACVVGAWAGAAATPAVPAARAASGRGLEIVRRIIDGDTLELADGRRVRFLQIDTPELGSGECYSRAARRDLLRLVPEGSAITLIRDPLLDDVDRYGRLLRYVRRGSLDVNLELVRLGAAAPYFYRSARGIHAARLLTLAVQARAARRGLWGACPGTRLDPDRAVSTGTSGRPVTRAQPGGRCDPSYAGACVPLVSGDLDCADLHALGIRSVRVVGPDHYRLDGDGDGIGCE